MLLLVEADAVSYTHLDVYKRQSEYFAVADLTAEFYADTVKRVFLDKNLAKGTMTYNGCLLYTSRCV